MNEFPERGRPRKARKTRKIQAHPGLGRNRDSRRLFVVRGERPPLRGLPFVRKGRNDFREETRAMWPRAFTRPGRATLGLSETLSANSHSLPLTFTRPSRCGAARTWLLLRRSRAGCFLVTHPAPASWGIGSAFPGSSPCSVGNRPATFRPSFGTPSTSRRQLMAQDRQRAGGGRLAPERERPERHRLEARRGHPRDFRG